MTIVCYRIPRRVTVPETTGRHQHTMSCMSCRLGHVLTDISDSDTVIVITSQHTSDSDNSEVHNTVEMYKIPIFLITFPSSFARFHADLTKYGAVFAVHEESQDMHPSILLQVSLKTFKEKSCRLENYFQPITM